MSYILEALRKAERERRSRYASAVDGTARITMSPRLAWRWQPAGLLVVLVGLVAAAWIIWSRPGPVPVAPLLPEGSRGEMAAGPASGATVGAGSPVAGARPPAGSVAPAAPVAVAPPAAVATPPRPLAAPRPPRLVEGAVVAPPEPGSGLAGGAPSAEEPSAPEPPAPGPPAPRRGASAAGPSTAPRPGPAALAPGPSPSPAGVRPPGSGPLPGPAGAGATSVTRLPAAGPTSRPAPEASAGAPARPGADTTGVLAGMTLDVLVYSEAAADRFVMINGRKYVEGQLVDGKARVDSIGPEGATLSYQGERVLLAPRLNPYARP